MGEACRGLGSTATLGDLAPLWPYETAKAAIEEAHRLGARVTAHCFDEESVQQLVRAGIDGIEHGTGLDADTIELMAARQVALVPTLIQPGELPELRGSRTGKVPPLRRPHDGSAPAAPGDHRSGHRGRSAGLRRDRRRRDSAARADQL